MKICLVLEGSYPYVGGGVSKWANDLICHLPEQEFILWTIGDFEKKRGQFKYELPANITLVQENFLDTALNLRVRRNANIKFSEREKEAISQLIRCGEPDWCELLSIFNNQRKNPVEFLMSESFLNILKEYAYEKYPFAGFADLFWTVRSMFLPLLYLIGQPIPQADLYHSISTGYAGVLGALGSIKYNKPYIVTEHGIYTREREEEILFSDWISPSFKSQWIAMFNMYARFAYTTAQLVTSLFDRASIIQQDLGCPVEKCAVIGNGIVLEKFLTVPPKKENGWVDMGAIIRFAPIKDVKTLIYTFANLKNEIKNVRLHILGPVDDAEYYQECTSLINFLGVEDIILTGEVNTREYLQKLDFTVLTSISEGQPLSIIESMAAGRPVVATNVGCCRELIEGEAQDTLGAAGICVPPMQQTDLLKAFTRMCRDVNMRKKMGEVGRKRTTTYFDIHTMVKQYQDVYEKAMK